MSNNSEVQNSITVFNNEEFGKVRTLFIGDIPYFVGKDVAEILGYSEPRSAVSKKVDEEDRGVAKMETPSGVQEMTVINESGLYSLILSSKLPNARKFKRWVTGEVLPTIRKTGSYGQENKSMIEQGISLVKFVADDLNVNEASRLLMYENYCKDVGVPTGFLPKYEHNGSREMKAPTHLLKENDCELSALKFNALLVEYGYLEEKERASSKGTSKKFKALTKKGLEYGENAVNPHNQKEVQPLYYSDRFMELYNLIAR